MKTLTNLEFKRDGQKNNAIVSRETFGDTKQVKELLVNDSFLQYIDSDNIINNITVTEVINMTINVENWEPVTNKGSYKYKFSSRWDTLNAKERVIVSLINNDPVLFDKYKFAFEYDNNTNIASFYAVKKPDKAVNIKLKRVGAN